jgi:hypothetical protein
MTTKIDSISNADIKCIFSSDEIDTLKDMGRKYALWEDDTGVDMTLSHLFSQTNFSFMFDVTEELRMTERMFPVSQFPEIWEKILQGPVQEEIELNDDLNTGWTVIPVDETTTASSTGYGCIIS